MIFDVLGAQANVVVLFDEIDRMILDRDSVEYGEQGDIFQFMTPSMLTKIRDLRKRKRLIFLVATNYAERIDAAAKRRGRLDMHGLLPPPDFEARRRIFGALMDRELGWKKGRFVQKFASRLDAVLDRTRFKVFGELKEMFDNARAEAFDKRKSQRQGDYCDALIEKLGEEAEKPISAAVTLASYRPRFRSAGEVEGDANDGGQLNPKGPYDEFLILTYIGIENNGELTNEERRLVEDILTNLAKKQAKEWADVSPLEKRQTLQNPIEQVLRGDSMLAKRILDGLYPLPG